MLWNLSIENIAVARQLEISWRTGFTVITGKTGAGKSIIIDSLLLLCGAKNGRELIRTGEEKATVSAIFGTTETEREKLTDLGYPPDENGEIQSQNVRWGSEWKIKAAEYVRMDIGVMPTGRVQAAAGSGSVTLKSDLHITALTMNSQGMAMVTSLNLGETAEPNPGRPSLILCRAGEDSLWEIAKRSGSTVELIEKANSLKQEPEESKMLIVPVL